jgi:hypothetical protein
MRRVVMPVQNIHVHRESLKPLQPLNEQKKNGNRIQA